MDKRTPERTCIGCRGKRNKDELVRVVLCPGEKEGDPAGIAFDIDGRMKGRGAYLCRKSECLELAVKKKAFNRAFKLAVSVEAIEGLADSFEREVK